MYWWRNPAYDEPDEHELAIMQALASSHHHFNLVPSTRDQRRARAWYRRHQRAAAHVGDAAAIAAPLEAAGKTAMV
jgi:hypothetical protein